MRTKQETETDSIKLTEQLYLDTFQKGVSMFYQDERSESHEFIKANPDGSEDLVRYERIINDYIFIQNLVPLESRDFVGFGISPSM